MVPRTNGSRNERWLAASRSGPLWGMCSWRARESVITGRYTGLAHPVTVLAQAMAIDRAQTVRGALAGAVAAGVWAAQQPLDKRVFGVDHDDVELLGKLVTRGPAWRPVGVALHLANGAAFGAAYSAVAPAVQLPSWSRGPLAGLAEHVSTWPLTSLVRLHPAAGDFPPLFPSP